MPLTRLLNKLKNSDQWQDEFQAQSDFIGKPLHADELWIPNHIRIDGKMLCWDETGRYKKPEPQMLDGFLQLSKTESSRDILKFAQKWGVLGFAQLKETAPETRHEIRLSDGSRFEIYQEHWPPLLYEPYKLYPAVARYMSAILNIAAALRLPFIPGTSRKKWEIERRGKESDWKQLDSGPNALPDSYEDANFFLTETINRQLEGRFGLRMWPAEDWGQSKWRIGICYGPSYPRFPLLSGLWLQVLLVASGLSGLYTCSCCGMVYVRLKKRPKAGNANYCDTCGLQAARRAARKSYNARRHTKMD
jgi:hypothetical protein